MTYSRSRCRNNPAPRCQVGSSRWSPRQSLDDNHVLLCDERLGLAPVVIKDIYKAIPQIKDAGASLIVVEQDIGQAMKVADRVYCMMEGRVTLSGAPESLSREAIHNAYFGASH